MGGNGEQRQECSVSACPPVMPHPEAGSSSSILKQQIPHSFQLAAYTAYIHVGTACPQITDADSPRPYPLLTCCPGCSSLIPPPRLSGLPTARVPPQSRQPAATPSSQSRQLQPQSILDPKA